MDENEYLHQCLIRERIREAEARGALASMLRHAGASEVRPSWVTRLLAACRRGSGRAPFASQADGSALG
jgi:hypothetical protein